MTWSDYDGYVIYGDYTVDEETGAVTALASYLPGVGQIDEATGTVYYYHADHLGSVRVVTSGGGLVRERIVHTAFGETVTRMGIALTPTRYLYAGAWGYESDLGADHAGGAPADDALPYQHLGFRWYNPASGRFLQRDPIGLLGGYNAYAYVGNTPTSLLDPTGFADSVVWSDRDLVAWIIKGACAGAATGAAAGAVTTGGPGAAAGATTGAVVGATGGAAAYMSNYTFYCVWDIVELQWQAYKINRNTRRTREAHPEIAWPPPREYPREPWTGYCFIAGTAVAVPGGTTCIEDLFIGATLVSYDPEANRYSASTVTTIIVGETCELVQVALPDGGVSCTLDHPFWVVDKGWTPARDLQPSDLLLNMKGRESPIVTIRKEALSEPIPVYNISVSEPSTFFAGDGQVLVHNKP